MDQDRRNPEEEAGGYGTPTVEQEMGGEQLAQPRTEQAIDEDADSAGEPGAGRMGGTEEQAKAERHTDWPDVVLPSAEAEMDEGNTDVLDRPDVDSSKGPDGGGTGRPQEKSPRDDEEEGERFDAG